MVLISDIIKTIGLIIIFLLKDKSSYLKENFLIIEKEKQKKMNQQSKISIFNMY